MNDRLRMSVRCCIAAARKRTRPQVDLHFAGPLIKYWTLFSLSNLKSLRLRLEISPTKFSFDATILRELEETRDPFPFYQFRQALDYGRLVGERIRRGLRPCISLR